MDKVSVIVGGSGGIGLESAKKLLAKGNRVCVWGNKNMEKLKSELRAFSPDKCGFYNVNLFYEESIEKNILSILNEHKSINSVVYSVSAPIKNGRIENLEWKDFQEHIDIQIKAFFTLVRLILKNSNQKERVKFIILLTEYCFGKPPSNISHYVAAKYGLMGFVKSLAAELDANKYTFNMVSPGMVETGLVSNLPPKLIEMTAQSNPLKRIATPTDVANIISFLDSEESNYLNGVNILVNGGSKFS